MIFTPFATFFMQLWGQLNLKITPDPELVERLRMEAGCFVLISNLDSPKDLENFSAVELLRLYKNQDGIERNFSFLKDQVIVNSIFLKRNHRLEVLGLVLLICLLIWRLFTITLIARTNPSMPCSELLTELEWTVLAAKSSHNGSQPATPPFIAEALISIAKLGGYLARKKDGPPGTLVLWRGWKRLMDLAQGWSMALMS